ncbi:uncharacterized protein [Amphiura filiformis]|uniref:uncharacterized protein n=1 Tax=Amphiura filiformis TaxID=82378 RepID=UPI003B22785B
MGPRDSVSRLPDRVHLPSSSVPGGSSHPVTAGPLTEGGLGGGDRSSPNKESHHTSPQGLPYRPLLHVLPYHKEIRGVAPNPQLEAPECLHQGPTFPDGDAAGGVICPSARLVGSHPRSERCIPPRTNLRVRPEMASLRVRRYRLSVPGPPVWPLHGPPDIHSTGQVGGRVSPEEGDHDIRLPRRLVVGSPLSAVSAPGCSGGVQAGRVPGVYHKPPEVFSLPISVASVPRGDYRLRQGPGFSYRLEDRRRSALRSADQAGSIGPGSVVASPSRADGQPHRSGSRLPATHEEDTVVLPRTVSSVAPSFEPQDSGHSASPPLPLLVDRSAECSDRRSIPETPPFPRPYHGCIQVRVGSPLSGRQALRALVEDSSSETHQSPRAVGHFPRPPPVGSTDSWPVHPGQMRQHDSCVLHQQGGGHQKSQPLQGDGVPPPVVSMEGYFPPCGASGRGRQHPGRFTVPRGASVIHAPGPEGSVSRVASSSSSLPFHLPEVRSPACRPVRVSSEPPTSDLLLLGPRPPGDRQRRHAGELGGRIRLRLPSHCSDPSGAREGSPLSRLYSPSSRSSLAQAVVVPPPPGPPSGGASQPSSPWESSVRSVTPAGSDGSDQQPPSDCLAYFRQSYQAAGLSESAAALAAKARRQSTRQTYDSRLRRFYRWCAGREIDPHFAPVGEVADFLTEVFHGGCMPRTAQAYRTAIAAVHHGFGEA